MFKKKDNTNFIYPVCIIGLLILSLTALAGVIGCSSSGSGSPPEYQLTGYNGVENSASSQAATAASNSGLKFYAPAPWFVNVTFQAYDKEDGFGVSDLLSSDFRVLEDGAPIDPIASELNIRQRDSLPSGFTYTLKTVLLLDNTPSLSANFDNMLLAAQVVVDNLDDLHQQQVALVAYDDAGDPVLIQDFTSSPSDLNKYLAPGATDAIKRSSGTSNFYGAVKFALDLWEDNPSPENNAFVQGVLVAITDGNDTTGLLNVDDVIAARGIKQVITVSVGTNFSESAQADLKRLGNFAYYPVPKPNIAPDEGDGKNPQDENLCEWMLVIQKRMLAFADGFYWLQYKSEKTSAETNKTHTVQVSMTENGNKDADAVIAGTFSSKDFISGSKGIYFDATAANPAGVTEELIYIDRGDAAGSVTDNVSAITYSRGTKNASKYTWTGADTDIITVAPKSNDSSTGVITAIKPGETTVTVKDTANGNVSATLIIRVVQRAFSYEIIQHEDTESAFPWYVDVTFQVREICNKDEFCCTGNCTDKPDWVNQWKWITDLKREELTLIENRGTSIEKLVDLEKSEVNFRKRDRIPSDFTYTLKTVLLIDNSPSNSDANYLDLIKAAAKSFVYRALVNNFYDNTDKGPLLDALGGFQQEIAIRSFTEDGDSTLVQSFTSDLTTLDTAIDSIPKGMGVINFYKGMIDSLTMWQNDESVRDGNNKLQQGVVLVLTDGWNSAEGFQMKDQVLGQRGDKQIICVGVADDLASAANISDLKTFGNDGYYSVPNPGETITQTLTADAYVNHKPLLTQETITLLQKTLRKIQDEILDYANSFYWLDYKSYQHPAEDCSNQTSFDAFITNNANTTNNDITGFFVTCHFFDGIDGMIYVNSTVTNPGGENGPITLTFDSTHLFLNPTYDLEAVTYFSDASLGVTPFYEWDWDNHNILTVDVDENIYDHSQATLRLPQNTHEGYTSLIINDIENHSSKPLVVHVEEMVFPMPIAFYPFDGNAIDETGHGYDGGVFNAALTQDRFGKDNAAYSFNNPFSNNSPIPIGQGQYIAIKNLHFGQDATAFENQVNKASACAWVRSTSDAQDMRIVSFEYQYFGLSLQGGQIGWYTNGSSGFNSMRTTDKFNDGQWHFVCGTLSLDGTKHIYVDGQDVKYTFIENPPEFTPGDTRYGFIGVLSEATTYNGDRNPWTYFTGDIDDVIIFNDALTQQQVQVLMQYLK